MISKIDIQKHFLILFENVKVGTYRGEDSGAIYPDYQEQITSCYDLNPIMDAQIDGKSINQLLKELEKARFEQYNGQNAWCYQYCSSNKTPAEILLIYQYVMALPDKARLKIEV